jgi:hypothetical protein
MAQWYYRTSDTDQHTSIAATDASWQETSDLCDGVAGNQSTYESYAPTPVVAASRSVFLYGLIDNCSPTAITAFDFTWQYTGTVDEEHIEGGSTVVYLMGSNTGASGDWTQIYTSSGSGLSGIGVWSRTNLTTSVTYRYVLLMVGFTAVGTFGNTLDPAILLSDYTVNANRSVVACVDPANEIPQCSTRTFAVDASPVPQLSTSLWEIVSPDGTLLDLGDRFDRFGPARWGVLSPGLGGSGTLTVTAPNNAPVASGYTARLASSSLTFDVTAGSGCPGSPSGASPAMIPFSTGRLYVARRLQNGTLTRTNIGTPSAASNPLANAFDGSLATTVDLTYTNGTNRQYAALDLGASKAVGSVLLRNVTCSGTVAVYVSATSITNGNFSGATALTSADTQPATGAPLLFLPVSPATTVTGRYIYIVCTSAAMSFGDLDVRGERIVVGAMQNGNLNLTYQQARLYEACWLNQYPINDGQYDIEVLLTAESAIWSPRAANLMYGTTYAVGGSDTTLTAGIVDKPIRFNAEFTVNDPTVNKNVRFTLYDLIAPGMQWQFDRGAFATNNFTASLLLSDTTAVPMRVEVDN